MSRTLILASHNQGKLKELEALIAPLGISALSAAKKNIPEPEETGNTFAENAALKAVHACSLSGLPALADDSGLVVPALGGAPGIYSARWAGPNKDFSSAFARIERELPSAHGTPAYFISALAYALPDGRVEHFEGRVDGSLTFPPRGSEGFGYDPIFIPTGHTKTFAELSADEKKRLSHRTRAFDAFITYLRQEAA